MLEELAPRWQSARESTLHERRGGERRRAAGAGPKQRLVFVDRLLVTLVHLRLGIPHAVLAELYGVDRSTASGAIREVRPLPATRGFAVPDRPGCGCGRWRTCSPTPARRALTCVSTAPKCRSAAPRPLPRPQGVRLRQEEAEHDQDHHLQ
ncbi:helix-turn-helix domain-containing protein [Streptomyces sp. NBC_00455]|uniref:helix-turn-helix domain-containing protein n=1 Tax=Streptomyces sp. NBC_00455 TaxID=2903654 RepID=UPI002E23429F